MTDDDLFSRHDAASALVPAVFGDGDAAKARARVRALLEALGAEIKGDLPRPQDGPPYLLVVHTSDYNYESTVYAVPDDAVPPAVREALRVVPECFAAPDDAYLACWGGILRLLAVWGLDGLTAAAFHDVMVEDFGAAHGHRDLPDLAEITALGGAWRAHEVARLDQGGTTVVDASAPWLGHRYRELYLFRQSM
ncbi:hypothetical protein ACQEVZ_58445 [Dactylosporangium sp. CA-152071]|uniref:hypothetical protein n=1 Tax=Dactylosporangium sp. CA-152071 TaxID=3239933 RepID=UPI003D8C9C0F